MSDEGLDNGRNVILINVVLTSSRVSAAPFSTDIFIYKYHKFTIAINFICNTVYNMYILKFHNSILFPMLV